MVSRLAEVDEFLKAQWVGDRPLLLGYSGGPDSKSLLYALLESGVKKLHLAHVDHGWREESALEAEELREEAHRLGCPFHSIRLQMPEKGNKEDLARQARLSFFRSLIDLIPCQALLLAHQADDLAETALKRILEGAHLPNICGMEPVSQYNGMSIWRPLLTVRKEALLHFLEERKLHPLLDSTNSDPAYLRARMRHEILPFLNASFGKQVEENLIFAANRSEELKSYLDQRIQKAEIQKGPWGQYVELEGMEKIEQRHLLQKMAREESVTIPRPYLESMLDWVEQKLPCKHLNVQSRDFYIDRGHVFILREKIPLFKLPLELKEGIHFCGDWKIEVHPTNEPFRPSDWKNVWNGKFETVLENGKAVLVEVPQGTPFRKLWNEKKVPAFLRFLVPVVENKGKVAKEFLSGKAIPEKNQSCKISFSFIARDSKSGL